MPLIVLPYRVISASAQVVAAAYGFDPYFEYVKFLSHAEGTNGATSTSDNYGTVLTGNNGATISTSRMKFGSSSMNFPASSGGFTTSSTGDFQFASQDFTVELWCYPTSFATGYVVSTNVFQSLISIRQFSNQAGAFSLYLKNGVPCVTIRSGSVNVVDNAAASALSLNAWHHVTLVRSGNNIYVFVDGTQVISTTMSGAIDASALPLAIGADSGGTAGFVGFIDDVRITVGVGRYTSAFASTLPSVAFPDAFGVSDVDPWYDSTPVLMHCDALDEVHGRTVTSSGVTVDSTLKRFGTGSLNFGTNGYLSLSTSDPEDFRLGPQDFTVECWVNIPSYSPGSRTSNMFYANGTATSAGATTMKLYINTSGNVVVGTGSSTVLTSSAAIPLNTWTHIAVTRNSLILTIWINGVQRGQYSNFGSGSYNFSDALFNIGSSTFPFTGNIDEFRLTRGACRYFTTFVPQRFASPEISPVTKAGTYDPYLGSVVLQLRMDGANNGTTFSDDKGKTVTAAGVTTVTSNLRSGTTGAVALFNAGTNTNGLSVPYSTDFAFTANDFTLEAWVYPTTITGSHGIFGNWQQGTVANCSWNLTLSGGVPTFYIGYSGSTTSFAATSAIPVNTWTHLAIVRHGYTLIMFTNGTISYYGHNAFGSSALQNGTQPIMIGNIPNGNIPFAGYMDDVRITANVARYTKNFTPPTSLPSVAYNGYSSRYSSDPYLNQTVTYLGGDGPGVSEATGKTNVYVASTAVPTIRTSPFGVINGSVGANGTANNYIQLDSPTNLTFGTNDFTIEFWVKFAAQGAYTLFDNRPFNTNGLYVTMGYDSSIGFQVAYNSITPISVGAAAPLNAWHHIAYVRSGGLVSFFVNGKKILTSYSLGSSAVNFAYNKCMMLGNAYLNGNGFNMNGWIDNVRITNGVARYLGNFDPSFSLPDSSISYVDSYLPNVKLLMHGEDLTDAAGNPMTVTGTVTSSATQAKFGSKSLQFNGTSVIKTGINPGLATGTGDFTAECWAYPTSANPNTNGSTLISWKDAVGTASTGAVGFRNDGKLEWGTNGGKIASASVNYTPNTWQHVAVTRASNVIYLFYNGNLVGSYSDTNSFTAPAGVAIGNRTDNNNTTGFTGFIDETRITVGVARYVPSSFTPSTTPATVDANTTLLMHMEGANGSTTFTDQNGATITKVGTPTISTTRFKVGSSSLLLNGTTDYLVTPVSADYGFGTGDFTVECWFYATDLSRNSQALWDMRAAGVSSQVKPTVFAQSGKIMFYVSATIVASYSISQGAWHHMAWSKTNGYSYFYVDGVLVSMMPDTNNYGTSNDFVIGQVGDSRNAAYYFGGNIDEVRITKGLARYIPSNVSPPTTAFSDV